MLQGSQRGACSLASAAAREREASRSACHPTRDLAEFNKPLDRICDATRCADEVRSHETPSDSASACCGVLRYNELSSAGSSKPACSTGPRSGAAQRCGRQSPLSYGRARSLPKGVTSGRLFDRCRFQPLGIAFAGTASSRSARAIFARASASSAAEGSATAAAHVGGGAEGPDLATHQAELDWLGAFVDSGAGGRFGLG
jgi:hypothetical protein